MTYHAVEGTMCFGDALVSLKKGGKVRRRAWPAASFLSIAPGPRGKERPSIRTSMGVEWRGSSDDLLAEDWEEAILPWNHKP